MNNLKGSRWFYTASPKELRSLDNLSEHLHSLLSSGTYIGEFPNSNGPVLVEAKELVKKIDGIKIEIYSNEHPPPHFHVKSADFSASFTLDSCQYIQGHIDKKNRLKIEYWYHKQGARKALIKIWNSSRPTDCVVGKYVSKHDY
jgi:hypothetical protein